MSIRRASNAVPDSTITVNNTFPGTGNRLPGIHPAPLALKQLDGVKTSLEHARTSASNDPQARYFFDYLQAQQDISVVEQGIRRYLAPARAQPRAIQPLSANYQQENPDD
ncbi:TPA: RAQPRD family integrative conjugative element protein [Escherichia coli]